MFAPTHPLQLVLGLIIWSVWFVLIYAVLSVACSVAPPINTTSPVNWINALLLALTLFTALLLILLAMRCWRARTVERNSAFIARVAPCVYVAAATSTLAIGIPALALPPCL